MESTWDGGREIHGEPQEMEVGAENVGGDTFQPRS